MMMCFMQTVENYVNIKEGTANFETDSFIKLLSTLKEVNLKNPTSALISDLAISSGAYNGVSFVKQQVDGLKDIAQTEAALCEKLCRVRLIAGADSNSSYFYLPYNTVGIFANSECKEGAFAFIEYMMTTDNNGMSMGVPSSGNDKAGLCYTLNSIREKAFSDALGDIEVSTPTGVITYAITDEHRKQMEALISEAKYLDDTHAQIIGIMMDEASSFLMSDKKPSEVAAVVQKRVQILLDERR
jgi:hypothetical protein